MVVKEFDRVILKTGETAYIADVIIPAKAYVVDVDKFDGTIEMMVAKQEDIEQVFGEKTV